MHISSLPSEYGIGTMGREAYRFVDFLKKGSQTYWQILPLCPIGPGNSPHQSISSFAGNPLFIDLDILNEEGLLDKNEYKDLFFGESVNKVDFGAVTENKIPLLKKAAKKLLTNPSEDFFDFCKNNSFWLDDFSLFSTITEAKKYKSFADWETGLLKRDPEQLSNFASKYNEDISVCKAIQYLFFKQWHNLKSYANENGIKIIGDIPIYVSPYSSDLWASPDDFLVDENYVPSVVAGVPPDGFSEDGQLWGNPVYNWKEMKKNGYSWWIQRIKSSISIYDVVRIDHFRGFDAYFCIKYGEKTAKNGKWRKGPGAALFKEAAKQLGTLPIIAEDLGNITDSVRKMLKETSFPGMKVLQFAFDSREDNDYLPYNYEKNSVVYTGTHDNDTIMGWLNSISQNDRDYAVKFMRLTESEGYNFGMMKTALASSADTCILTKRGFDLYGYSQSRADTQNLNNDRVVSRERTGQILHIFSRKQRLFFSVTHSLLHFER